MSNFTRANIINGGWTQSGSAGETITATQINHIDINQSKAINGTEGGTYSPSSPIILAGANALKCSASGAITLDSGVVIKRTATSTVYSQPNCMTILRYSTGSAANNWDPGVYPNGSSVYFASSIGYGATINLHKVAQPFTGLITNIGIRFELPANLNGGTKSPIVKFYQQKYSSTPVQIGSNATGTSLIISPTLPTEIIWNINLSSNPHIIDQTANYFLSVTDDNNNAKEIHIMGWTIAAIQTDILPL